MGNEITGEENGPFDSKVRGNSRKKLKRTTSDQRFNNSAR
jgi:hypothetical protein